MSGAWTRSFTLSSPQSLTLSFRYRLTQAANLESDEVSEALIALDNNLIGIGATDLIARIAGNGNGGVNQTTGWVQVNLDLGNLNGEHTISIGSFNNKKTYNNEFTTIVIDDVVLQAIQP